MLIYEHNRTEEFIDGLLKTSKQIRLLLLIICCAYGALTGLVVGASIDGGGGEALCAIIGLGLGWVVGGFGNMIVSAVTEWMAQMLIAQGEMVEHLKVRK